MKISSTFHVSVFLMAVLTANIPFAALAQQNFVMTQVETAATQDSNAVSLEAKAAAEQDAKNDFSMLNWFGAGLCLGGGITSMGAVVGTNIADQKYPNRFTIEVGPTESYFGYFPYPSYIREIRNQDQIDGYNRVRLQITAASSLVSLSLSWLLASSMGKPPSKSLPERFIGKSSEYIHVYNEIYNENIQPLRKKALVRGSALGSGCILFGLLAAQE